MVTKIVRKYVLLCGRLNTELYKIYWLFYSFYISEIHYLVYAEKSPLCNIFLRKIYKITRVSFNLLTNKNN